jgi:hypothetical protein
VGPLNAAGIDYMVTGGLAAVIYGHPRLTLDIDLVLKLSRGDVDRLAGLWSLDEFYVPPIEVMLEESLRPAHGHFNLIHNDTSMRADIYIAGVDELNAWSLPRCAIREIDGVRVRVAPVEAVILWKLRYFVLGGSDRHLRDVARMVEISADEIDNTELGQWLERLDLADAWTRAQQYREE